MKNILLLVLLTFIYGCSEYIPIAGGKLQGMLTLPPGDWTEIAKADIIELETNPTDPYSVKLWVIGKGADLYVHAGDNRARWVEHMEIDPNVRLLIDGKLFELSSVRVESADEFRVFANVYEEKYGNRPRNENVNEAYLFRLVPRD